MQIVSFKTIDRLFFMICLFATICLSIYSLNRYFKNEDTTVLKVTNFFSSNKSIYPSLTFCIVPPFLDEQFDMFGDKEINTESYIKFLEGEFWDEKLADIDYDNVTVSLDSNILGANITTTSEDTYAWSPKFYTSFKSSERKCFTIDAPIQDHILWHFNVSVKNTIFPYGIRVLPDEIRTYFHYPGQFFSGLYTVKYDFPSRKGRNSKYKMHFEIKDIDVVTRRNKMLEPCIENMTSYDRLVIAKKLTEVGCYPPHVDFDEISKSNLPKCNNATQMKEIASLGMGLHDESINRPCRSISRIDFTYLEIDMGSSLDGLKGTAPLAPGLKGRKKRDSGQESYFEIEQVYRQTSFTDKIQTKAYTFDDVVGTVGGYIGLFLGYAWVQIPSSIAWIFNSMKHGKNENKGNYVV